MLEEANKEEACESRSEACDRGNERVDNDRGKASPESPSLLLLAATCLLLLRIEKARRSPRWSFTSQGTLEVDGRAVPP